MSTKEPEHTIKLDKPQFDSLVSSIRDLVKVYAAAQIKQDAGTEQNARYLRVFGFSQGEIADLLSITQPAVSQALKPKKKKQTENEKGSNDAIAKA